MLNYFKTPAVMSDYVKHSIAEGVYDTPRMVHDMRNNLFNAGLLTLVGGKTRNATYVISELGKQWLLQNPE